MRVDTTVELSVRQYCWTRKHNIAELLLSGWKQKIARMKNRRRRLVGDFVAEDWMHCRLCRRVYVSENFDKCRRAVGYRSGAAPRSSCLSTIDLTKYEGESHRYHYVLHLI